MKEKFNAEKIQSLVEVKSRFKELDREFQELRGSL